MSWPVCQPIKDAISKVLGYTVMTKCQELSIPVSVEGGDVLVKAKTGTGKTLCVQYVGQEILRRSEQQEATLQVLYINCKLKKIADTEYRILAELLQALGEKVPPTGLPTDALYNKFIEHIDSKKQVILIILDEIDHVQGA